MEQNLISKAVEIVGLAKLARVLGVTYQAIRKWEVNGKLPRTEWTGETDYASLIEQATNGQVLRGDLLAVSVRQALAIKDQRSDADRRANLRRDGERRDGERRARGA